jgi:hypothetical protein
MSYKKYGSKGSQSKSSLSRSKSKEKQRNYQWVHPMYSPIDYKLSVLNNKFKEFNKSGRSMKSSLSQVSFNQTNTNRFCSKLIDILIRPIWIFWNVHKIQDISLSGLHKKIRKIQNVDKDD